MRCEYCNHSGTAPNITRTTFGAGSVNHYSDIGKHLCDECNTVSTDLVFVEVEWYKEEEDTID